MRLFCVIGKAVRKYSESPGLAPRVEIPFSSTTANRVPAGTLMRSAGPLLRASAGCGGRAAAAGGEIWGPSGCWASAMPPKAQKASRMVDAKRSRHRFIVTPLDVCAMPAEELRMPAVNVVASLTGMILDTE